MNPLKAFRTIPQDIKEWGRWFQAQSIPDPVSDTIATGSTSFSGTTPVSVSIDEEDKDYSVFVDGSISETFWVTNKQLTSFSINSSNSGSTASVTWMLVRR